MNNGHIEKPVVILYVHFIVITFANVVHYLLTLLIFKHTPKGFSI